RLHLRPQRLSRLPHGQEDPAAERLEETDRAKEVGWRKRMGIEPTARCSRAAGFEDQGSHQAPFASGASPRATAPEAPDQLIFSIPATEVRCIVRPLSSA